VKVPYIGRLGKDRSPTKSRHSIASAKLAGLLEWSSNFQLRSIHLDEKDHRQTQPSGTVVAGGFEAAALEGGWRANLDGDEGRRPEGKRI
jgi:hypothetical protein